ncbi:MAG: MATE family efflux transporter [Phycisphaerales bacterium]|nr:MATE family efflux transporter [Phycisphaerales bacterium]
MNSPAVDQQDEAVAPEPHAGVESRRGDAPRRRAGVAHASDRLESPVTPRSDPRGDGRIRTGKLAGLSLGMAIWVLSWPIMAQSFLDALLGTVDTAVAARLGVEETDAVGLSTYIMWFTGVITMSVAIGATALISRAVGSGHRSRANDVLGQSMTLAIIIGVAAGIVMAIAAPFLGRPCGLDPVAAKLMAQYLWPIAASMPAMVVTNVGVACLRGAGESRSPLWIMMIENIINLPLNGLLSGVALHFTVMGRTIDWPGIPSIAIGIAGVGVATCIARCVGAVIVLWLLWRGEDVMRLHWHRMKPRLSSMKRLMNVGLPNLWESLGMWMGNFFIILVIGQVLAAAAGAPGLIGAHQITIRLESFSFLPGFAMGTAAATLMGQYLGAGNPRMAARAALVCAGVAAVVMSIFSYFFIFHPVAMVSVMSDQEMHRQVVPDLLRLAGYIQVPFAILLVLRGGLRGAGDTRMAMIITSIGIYAIRVPGCLIAALLFPEKGLYPLWLVMVCELTIRCLMFTARFLHGGWMRIKV